MWKADTAMPVLAETNVTLLDVVMLVRDAGPFGLFILIGWGLLKKKWVPGWMYDNERQEKEMWREVALRGTTVAERVTSLMSQKEEGR